MKNKTIQNEFLDHKNLIILVIFMTKSIKKNSMDIKKGLMVSFPFDKASNIIEFSLSLKKKSRKL